MNNQPMSKESICKRIVELQQLIKTESKRLDVIRGNYRKRINAAVSTGDHDSYDSPMRVDLALSFEESILNKLQELAGYQKELYQLRVIVANDLTHIQKENTRNIIACRYIYGMTAVETTENLFYSDEATISKHCRKYYRTES